jgi:hypothetical protein
MLRSFLTSWSVRGRARSCLLYPSLLTPTPLAPLLPTENSHVGDEKSRAGHIFPMSWPSLGQFITNTTSICPANQVPQIGVPGSVPASAENPGYLPESSNQDLT